MSDQPTIPLGRPVTLYAGVYSGKKGECFDMWSVRPLAREARMHLAGSYGGDWEKAKAAGWRIRRLYAFSDISEMWELGARADRLQRAFDAAHRISDGVAGE